MPSRASLSTDVRPIRNHFVEIHSPQEYRAVALPFMNRIADFAAAKRSAIVVDGMPIITMDARDFFENIGDSNNAFANIKGDEEERLP